MRLAKRYFLNVKIKSCFQRVNPASLRFCGLEWFSVCILGLFSGEIWFLTGPAVNSQLGVNLLGQYFGREAISNQETFKDAFRMIRRSIIEV